MSAAVRARRRVVALLSSASAVVLALSAPSSRAHAQDGREECFTAYEQAQRLRLSGALVAARERLATCSLAACPAFVRADCTQWTEEVDARLSTVVIKARDERGDASDRVEVFVDDERLVRRTDGSPIRIDPGAHVVRYELAGRSVEQHVTVPEGAREFPLAADLRASESPPTALTPPSSTARDASTTPPRTIVRLPPATYALGGVAAVGALSFTAFAVAGKSTESCAPHCSDAAVTRLRRDYALADVSLVVTLAAAGGALYFAFAHATHATTEAKVGIGAPTRGAFVRAVPAPGGGSIAAGASF